MSGYTKLPNHIIEAMPEMGKAELKVTIAIVRHTYGFHRDECKLTFSDLEELTGMSRGGVAAGAKDVIRRGFFVHDGSTWTVYSIDQNGLVARPNGGLVNRPEQSNSYTESVYLLDQNTPILKKDKEREKEREEVANAFWLIPENIKQKEFLIWWKKWLEHVDQAGLTFTETQATVKLAALSDAGLALAIKSLEQTISRGWKNIHIVDAAVYHSVNGHNGTANDDGSFY